MFSGGDGKDFVGAGLLGVCCGPTNITLLITEAYDREPQLASHRTVVARNLRTYRPRRVTADVGLVCATARMDFETHLLATVWERKTAVFIEMEPRLATCSSSWYTIIIFLELERTSSGEKKIRTYR